MPAWATVVITLGASVVAVIGTLGATLLQLRSSRRERAIQAAAERRSRAAEILGRVRTLLADLDPTRVAFNIRETTPEQLEAIEKRWLSLRDDLSVFAARDEDQRVTDAASELEIGVSNTISRVAWHVDNLLTHRGAAETYQDAVLEHLRATAYVRIVHDLVRGRDVAELEQTLQRIDARATSGQQDQPRTAETEASPSVSRQSGDS